MADFRTKYNDLLGQSVSNLEDRLRPLLPPGYKDRLTGNRNAGLLEGAFKAIEPKENPYTFVKTWHNYDSTWSKGKSAATALRMLLTEQIGLPRYEVVRGYTRPTLSKMICGIEAANNGVPRGKDKHAPLTLPVDIEPPLPEPPELPQASAEYNRDIIPTTDFKSIISIYGNPSGKHAVYVLDCTPSHLRERKAMKQLRRHTLAKSEAGFYDYNEPNWMEEYAIALNNGERIYYVGEAGDLNRMKEHHEGSASGGADFTNFFKPRGIFDLEWYDSEAEAKAAEPEVAMSLNRSGKSRAYYN